MEKEKAIQILVEQAFMAGQAHEGVDPSASAALEYYNSLPKPTDIKEEGNNNQGNSEELNTLAQIICVNMEVRDSELKVWDTARKIQEQYSSHNVISEEQFRKFITQAHMDGQADANIDPSYISALAYYCGLKLPLQSKEEPLTREQILTSLDEVLEGTLSVNAFADIFLVKEVTDIKD